MNKKVQLYGWHYLDEDEQTRIFKAEVLKDAITPPQ